MKKIKFLCVMLMFTIFVPKVYAFTYDIDVSIDDMSITEGATRNIKVILKDVQGLSEGFASCSMKIDYDDTITLNGEISALSGWIVTAGNIYTFDTNDSFKSDSEMFLIPVKINKAGDVRLSNIACSDGNTKEIIADKVISFSISQNGVNISENAKIDISSFNITNIVLSEGNINFNPEVTEYTVNVSNFDNLEVSAEFGDSNSSYIVDRNVISGEKSITVTVTNALGDSIVYTINVIEDGVSTKDNTDGEQKNNYAPIFIGIICLLVFINVFRIVRNIKK